MRLITVQVHWQVSAQLPVKCIINNAEPAIEQSAAIRHAAAPSVASLLDHHFGESQVVMQIETVVKLDI